MNIISVEVTYPKLHQPSLTTPPRTRTPTPITHPQSLASNSAVTQKGIAGCYDVNELNEELSLFGISERTRTALLRERKPVVRRVPKTAMSTLTHDTQYTNSSPSSMSRKSLLRHSASSRSCFVDFSGNFHDTVRAQSVQMEIKSSTPAVHPNLGQRILPKTPHAPKRRKNSKRKNKQHSTPEPVQIKGGLLVISNGQAVVDFRKDVKRSENLEESERKKLREKMREHLSIVQSFDDIFEKFDATKMQIEQMKTM